MLKIATTFSGIGAPEQALAKAGIEHQIVFACDNGERTPSSDISDIIDCLKESTGTKTTHKFLLDLLARKTGNKDIRKLDYDGCLAILGEIDKESLPDLASICESIRKLPADKVRLFASEWYKRTKKPNHQRESYFANYDITGDKWFDDIRLFDGRPYRGTVDLFVGGSPCQAFSSNGKRGGLEDTRGTLFYEYGRVISEVRPKAFIFENVQGLLVHDNGKTWQIVKSVFQSLGYDVYINHDNGIEQPLLDSQNYGIPQRRKRIYIIGIDARLRHSEFQFPQQVALDTCVSDYLDENVDAKYYLAEKGFTFVTTSPTRARIAGKVMGCQKANQQFNWNGDFIFEPLAAISNRGDVLARAHVGIWNGQRGVIRKFTPRECLRLMGFPDTFKIVQSDTEMYRQAGNSMSVNVIEAIIRQLFKCGIFHD